MSKRNKNQTNKRGKCEYPGCKFVGKVWYYRKTFLCQDHFIGKDLDEKTIIEEIAYSRKEIV